MLQLGPRHAEGSDAAQSDHHAPLKHDTTRNKLGAAQENSSAESLQGISSGRWRTPSAASQPETSSTWMPAAGSSTRLSALAVGIGEQVRSRRRLSARDPRVAQEANDDPRSRLPRSVVPMPGLFIGHRGLATERGRQASRPHSCGTPPRSRLRGRADRSDWRRTRTIPLKEQRSGRDLTTLRERFASNLASVPVIKVEFMPLSPTTKLTAVHAVEPSSNLEVVA